MTTESSQKNDRKYFCEICDYSTCKKCNYDKHLLSRKHENSNNNNPKVAQSSHECNICNKCFNDRAGLWRHKKKCSIINNLDETQLHPHFVPSYHSSTEDMQMTLILELVKQNQEFKDMLIQQSSQMMEQNKNMVEVAKNSQINNNTINNTTTSNSHNKTFNLNFFLNETCKDAMNMKDFIKSLEMSFSELEKMGEVGFAEGMSRLFVDRLNKLDITKRPIHCSDIKREIIHIKDDNKWERDNANLDRLRKIIKQLTIKNILRVDDWKKANTGCTEYNNRKNGQYLKMHIQALGPVDDDEVKRDFGKIIRRVVETTAVQLEVSMPRGRTP